MTKERWLKLGAMFVPYRALLLKKGFRVKLVEGEGLLIFGTKETRQAAMKSVSDTLPAAW